MLAGEELHKMGKGEPCTHKQDNRNAKGQWKEK
jgi:hypothetical protein